MIKELAMVAMLLTSTAVLKAESIPMTVQILPDFGIGVDTDKFKFLPTTGGNATSASVGLNVGSSKDTGWSLQISSLLPFIRKGGTEVIPTANVTYRVSGGLGTKFPGDDTSAPLPQFPKTIYSADVSEYSTAGTMVTLTININPPKFQKAGEYTSTLNVALIDNF